MQEKQPISSPSRSVYGILLMLVLVMAAAVRFYGLGSEDYWFDELYSLSFSAGKQAAFASLPFGEIIREFDLDTEIDEASNIRSIARAMRAVDTHPPVYFVLLRGWRALLGEGEFKVRSLSAIISFLSIVVLWATFAAIGRYRAGLFASAITALSYSHVFIGQQNRHYSLSVLLSGLTFLLLVCGERSWAARDARSSVSSKRDSRFGALAVVLGLSYAATLYLAVLTHYFAGLPLLGQAVYAITRLRRRALAVWVTTTLVAAVAAGATWLPSFLDQIDVMKAQRWLIDPVSNHTAVTILRFLDLPVRLLMWAEVTEPNIGRSLAGSIFLAVVAVILFLRRDKQAFLFAMWFLVPVVFMFVVDLFSGKQTLFPLRYPVIATPGFVGLVALAIDGLGRTKLTKEAPMGARSEPLAAGGDAVAAYMESPVTSLVALGGLLVVMAMGLPLPAIDHAHAREAAQLLREKAVEEDLIVYDAVGWPLDWVPQFFSPMAYYSRDLKNPVLLLRDPMTEELGAEVAEFERVFVVSPRIDALPHPSPQTHELKGRSEYIHQIGWIYLFMKSE
jgi:uncharacterized membrane protein